MTSPRETAAALKEWAAMEQALGQGRTTLLLRKGGIAERRGGFETEHREFWIFPTGFHQNRGELVAEAHDLLDLARAAEPPRDQVRLQHYAEVADAVWIDDLPTLERLAGLHPLTPETVRSRFHYRRPGLHCLVLRVHALAEPLLVPNTVEYEGCVSWVELDRPLPTVGARPVLGDDEWKQHRARILDRLQHEVLG